MFLDSGGSPTFCDCAIAGAASAARPIAASLNTRLRSMARSSRMRFLLDRLPLPACGERVGVKGALDEFGAWRVPLTRRYAATSRRKRGEGTRNLLPLAPDAE